MRSNFIKGNSNLISPQNLRPLPNKLHNKGLSGIDVNFFKIFLILYADDIVIFAESKDELQRRLDALLEYCNRC